MEAITRKPYILEPLEEEILSYIAQNPGGVPQIELVAVFEKKTPDIRQVLRRFRRKVEEIQVRKEEVDWAPNPVRVYSL